MKTAISIPDDVFDAAEQAASAMAMSRSQFYTRAVREYLDKLQQENVTERLNDIYKDERSRLDPVSARIQSASIGPDSW